MVCAFKSWPSEINSNDIFNCGGNVESCSSTSKLYLHYHNVYGKDGGFPPIKSHDHLIT